MKKFEDESVDSEAQSKCPFISYTIIPSQFLRCFLLFHEGPDITQIHILGFRCNHICSVDYSILPHILLPRCPLLMERSDLLLQYVRERLSSSSLCTALLESVLESDDEQRVQFFLDPTVLPEVIAANQEDPSIFSQLLQATTTWCYSLHRTRLKLLGRF